MQTAFNTLTVINSIVLTLIVLAIAGSKRETKATQEFDSWWESDPNETKETPKDYQTFKGTNEPEVYKVKGSTKTSAPRKATTTQTKKRSGQVVQPVRKAKRLSQTR